MSQHLRKWSTKSLIKLKEVAEADIVSLQGDVPSNDTEKLVVDTLLEDRKATIAEVNTILAVRK